MKHFAAKGHLVRTAGSSHDERVASWSSCAYLHPLDMPADPKPRLVQHFSGRYCTAWKVLVGTKTNGEA